MSIDIAVVGATSTAGEAMLTLLAARQFPMGELYALAPDEDLGKSIDAGRHELTVDSVEQFDFGRAGLVLFAAGEAAQLQAALDACCIVIDASGRFCADPEVPLVIPEINPEAIAAFRERGIIASPGTHTVQLLATLNVIHHAVGLARIQVVTCASVSNTGRAAVQELVRQTVELLNGRTVQPAVYDRQIAFNILPLVGTLQEDGYTNAEHDLQRDSRRLLADPDLVVDATTLRVPVFYGDAQVVHLETKNQITVEQARNLLNTAPGVKVLDAQAGDGVPTSVGEAGGSDQIWVGRLRENGCYPRGLDLWIVADNVRRGVALNVIKIAEILVKQYL